MFFFFNQNTKLFLHENAYENIVCEMVAILSRGGELNYGAIRLSSYVYNMHVGYQYTPYGYQYGPHKSGGQSGVIMSKLMFSSHSASRRTRRTVPLHHSTEVLAICYMYHITMWWFILTHVCRWHGDHHSISKSVSFCPSCFLHSYMHSCQSVCTAS